MQILKPRSWHSWTSILVALPILVITVTALLMAHKKALGTEDIKLAAHWLPGYQATSVKSARNDVRGSLWSGNGDAYLATLSGLYRWSGGQLSLVEELGDTQIRALAQASWGRIAAAKNGVWWQDPAQDGRWRRVLGGDSSGATVQSDGSVVVAVRERGLLASRDGQHWQADAPLSSALNSLPSAASAPITLSRLLLDLHTGQALLGKDGQWVWIDLISLVLSLLALTGVYMWSRTQWRKRVASRKPRRDVGHTNPTVATAAQPAAATQ